MFANNLKQFSRSTKEIRDKIKKSRADEIEKVKQSNYHIEITPKGVIDRYTTFDEYLDDPKIKELRTKMYS